MPRAGWLAAGALFAAVGWEATGGELGSNTTPLLGGALAASAVIVALGLRWRSMRLVASVAGVGLVLLRLVVGSLFGGGDAPAAIPTTERDWHAEVISVGSTSGGQQRALVKASDGSGQWRIYVWLPRYPSVLPTDRLRFEARLEPAPQTEGFGEFLARSGAVATARVAAFDHSSVTDAVGVLEGTRRHAGELIAIGLPAPSAGLAAGILVGLRDLVDRDLAEDFATAGVSHVVAISGWNICLVGAIVAAVLGRWPRRRRAATMLLAIGLYTLLAGASPSVVRAAVMGGVCLVARESGRRGGAATGLGLAAAAMLLMDPAVAADVGFLLSVAATGGLLAWSTGICTALRRRLPVRTPGWLIESLGVSLAAQAATLPLVLLHFGRLSLVAPAANLIIAPIVAPAMFGSLLGLTAGMALDLGVPGVVVAPLSLLATLPLDALISIGRAAAALPLASVGLPQPLAMLAAAATGFGLWCFGTAQGGSVMRWIGSRSAVVPWRHRSARPDTPPPASGGAAEPGSHARSRTHRGIGAPARAPRRLAQIMAITGAGLLVVAGSLAAGTADGRLRMTVLDIGQGDSMLLEGDRGSRILVDGGPDPDRLATLLDERIPAWDRRVDLVVLTHPHEDHVAGLPLLLQRYRVPVVAEPGMIGNGPGDREFRSVSARLTAKRVVLAAGDRLRLDGAAITVLWPRRGEVPLHPPDDGTGINNVSIVMDIRYGTRRLLLAGDMEEEVDPALLAEGSLGDQRVDVLKVAHHGSRTSSTAPFLASVAPRVAVVSAGRDNPYGHPAPETLERLSAAGARVLRTDVDGTVTVSTNGRDLSVSTTGGRTGAADPGPGALSKTLGTGTRSSPVPDPFDIGLLCSVPIPRDDRIASPIARAARGMPDQALRSAGTMGRIISNLGSSGAVIATLSEPAYPPDGACYDRPRAHPLATRSARRAGRLPAGRPAPTPLHRGRGDRLVPGGMHRRTGDHDGLSTGRERSPPA